MVQTDGPKVVFAGLVDRDVLALSIQDGRIIRGSQQPYSPKPGDSIQKWGEYQRWVVRDGKIVGGLVGSEGKILAPFDSIVEPAMDAALLKSKDSFQVAVSGRKVEVVQAGFSTRPTGLAKVGGFEFRAPLEHTVYLKLARPLEAGETASIGLPGNLPPQSVAMSARSARGKAVQVNHFGFRPNDPLKLGFLSAWLGSLGPHDFKGPRPFWVVEESTGNAVLRGNTRLRRAVTAVDEDNYNRNYSGADVYEADFSRLNKPGSYRLCVEGAGCSMPFAVAQDPYAEPFRAIAKGFLIQRSGIPLGPPLTPFRRPRTMNQADGFKVLASTTSLLQSANGLNMAGDKDNFASLVKGKTEQVVADAWGGYMDAGDWDRRVQHLDATRMQLDLVELFPSDKRWNKLGIPESSNSIPDLVDEAAWGLEVYRRMQLPEGAIRGGIESDEHPLHGEASWQESLDVMAYAPDPWSSFLYAATASKLSRVLKPLDRAAAAAWLGSARRAMDWAQKDMALRDGQKLPHAVKDAENLAAIELFRTTLEPQWMELFSRTTAFTKEGMELAVWQEYNQSEAAFSLLMADPKGVDAALRARVLDAFKRTADMTADASESSGFGWGKETRWHPLGFGRLTIPPVVLARAHRILKDERYLRALIRTAQFGLGANPNHLCFVTGIGHKSPRWPLHVDSLVTGQAPPEGLPLYGPLDPVLIKGGWEEKLLDPFLEPDYQGWPAAEAYFDVFWMPLTNEYTIMESMGPAQFAYGYLAART